jgi:hypothetical protein
VCGPFLAGRCAQDGRYPSRADLTSLSLGRGEAIFCGSLS